MEVLEFWLTPPVMHALAVHAPLGLAFAGVPLIFISAAIARERATVRGLTVACYAALAGSAFLAKYTGERARSELSGALPGNVWDLVSQHEFFAEKVWIFALVTTALMALSLLRPRWVQSTAMTLAMIAGLATASWTAVAGHLGGALVYIHGVGVAHVVEPMQVGAASGVPAGTTDVLLPIREIEPAELASIEFARDIRPVLEEACIDCHNMDKARGGLDLETAPLVEAEGKKAGRAIIPGDPDASPFIKYIRGELKPQMPKGEKPISPDELHALRVWIKAGALEGPAPAASPPDTLSPPAPTVTVQPGSAPQ